MKQRYRGLILLLLVLVFVFRTWFGTTLFSGVDTFQVYLIGLKWYTSGLFPFWGPDVVYTGSQLPGALQGLLVGAPFFIKAIPEAPYVFLNLLSMSTLCYLGWYLSERIPGVPKWFIYGWLLTAPWTLHYSTMIENPSYVLPVAIMFFISIWELFPFYATPLIQRKWAFFWLGFALFWVMQLHLSWVLMLPFIGLAFLFQLKKGAGLGSAVSFFSLGAIITFSTLAPTLWYFGGNATGGSEQNIALNPKNLLEFFSVLGKYLSFASAEVPRFLGANTEERLSFLKNYPWAAPFTVVYALLGLSQVGYFVGSFFLRKSIPEWNKVRIFTVGSIFLVWLSYLFATQLPRAHAFYMMFPVAMWYSFYCYVNLFKNKYWRSVFAIFLGAGILFHVALFQKNSDQFGLIHQRQKLEAALQQKDYTLLGTRRESKLEVSNWGNVWEIPAGTDSLVFKTGFEYNDPYFKPQNIITSTAHTGAYCCKMDSIQPFGLNFKQPISFRVKPNECHFDGFLKGDFEGEVTAVLDIHLHGKSVLWQSLPISHEQFSHETWTPISLTFGIPDTLQTWDEASVYISLNSKNAGRLFVDDVQVRFR